VSGEAVRRLPDVRLSGSPAFRPSGPPAVRLSGFPAVRMSGGPEVRRTSVRQSGFRQSVPPPSGFPAIRRPALRLPVLRSSDFRPSGPPHPLSEHKTTDAWPSYRPVIDQRNRPQRKARHVRPWRGNRKPVRYPASATFPEVPHLRPSIWRENVRDISVSPKPRPGLRQSSERHAALGRSVNRPLHEAIFCSKQKSSAGERKTPDKPQDREKNEWS
jgi:hypothetical protein